MCRQIYRVPLYGSGTPPCIPMLLLIRGAKSSSDRRLWHRPFFTERYAQCVHPQALKAPLSFVFVPLVWGEERRVNSKCFSISRIPLEN